MIVGKKQLYRRWRDRWSVHWKRRRFRRLMALIPRPEGRPMRVLEVGCGTGRDMLQFMEDGADYELWGVDLKPRTIPQANVRFLQADGAELPFADGSFDLVVTVGVLEHIEPMEKLCRMVRELDRVGVHQLSVVPSVSTWLEPHCGGLAWPRRFHPEMAGVTAGEGLRLNFLTDHTWTKFLGFSNCKVRRISYIPALICNTVIYR